MLLHLCDKKGVNFQYTDLCIILTFAFKIPQKLDVSIELIKTN